MKYIIMCGGDYPRWETPRQLLEINGETLVERTIRLLKEHGVKDIAISSNNETFKQFGVPVLSHTNDYVGYEYNVCEGQWCNAFYPMNDPACYLFGDVFYSPEAIETIVEYETNDVMFFGSAPPFLPPYPKPYEEPFAFKVADQKHFMESLEEVKRIDSAGGFYRKPIAWEVWNVINGGNPNTIDYSSYIRINDYTCDIDKQSELALIQRLAKMGGKQMATKKKEPTKKTPEKRGRKPKAKEVLFRERKYILLEEANGKCKLTDGMIHFWARGDEVVKAD